LRIRGTLLFCISFPNCVFRLSASRLLAHSFPTGHSEFRLKAKCPRPLKYKQGCLRFRLGPTLYSLSTNDTPHKLGLYLDLFNDDTCVCATDRKEGYVLRKLRSGVTSKESCCELWNIKIFGGMMRSFCFPHGRKSVEVRLLTEGTGRSIRRSCNILVPWCSI